MTAQSTKLWLLALALFLACFTRSYGINASPWPVDLVQADGTNIRLYVRGDENVNWFEDEKGFSVVRSGQNYLYAERGADGGLAATPLKVGRVDPAVSGLTKKLTPTPEAVRAARVRRLPPAQRAAAEASGAAAPEAPSGSTPASGTVKNLVVLCQFSDHDASKTRTAAEFDKVMNAVGGDATLAPTGSVRDYYAQASYGIVTLDSTVVAWVTLPHTEAYYANGSSGLSGSYPADSQGMVKDALDLVDPLVDFGQFDANNDGMWMPSISFTPAMPPRPAVAAAIGSGPTSGPSGNSPVASIPPRTTTAWA